ncbi:MAG: type II secretion system F family protein [Euryarchaeota archaeon]|nr:type II secretion system F family protein [Euryarchaeota archaeon]
MRKEIIEEMSLNNYHQFCYKRLGRFAERKVNEKLNAALASAHMDVRGAAYIAFLLMTSLLVFVVSFVAFVSFLVVLVFVVHVAVDIFLVVVFLVLPAILFGATYGIGLFLPSSKAKARKKNIDVNLAYAVNFISAMSSAGITPTEVFKSLSKQEIYGEVKEEAAWIYRDVAMLGSDIITSIRSNIERTPSQRFKEFLQGTVVTVSSGGSLKTYFVAKGDQYMRENRQMQKQRIESLGIMAESYVTAAVAGVLMLLIVIPLMMIISVVSGSLSPSGFQEQMMLMYIIVFVLIPIIHFGFAFVIKSMANG